MLCSLECIRRLFVCRNNLLLERSSEMYDEFHEVTELMIMLHREAFSFRIISSEIKERIFSSGPDSPRYSESH